MKTKSLNRLKQTLIAILTGAMVVGLQVSHAAAGQDGQQLPASVRVVLSQVNRLIEKADYDGAVEKLTAFQARGGPSPAGDDAAAGVYRHPMIDLVLGSCLLCQGRYADAEMTLTRATRHMPERTAAWLNLAKACYEQGKHALAATHFAEAYDRAEKKQPDHLYYSAAAYLMARRYKRAVAAFERLQTHHPDRIEPAWRAHWVNALLSDGRARRALPHIRTLIAQYDGKERIRWQEVLLYQYIQLDMTDQARRYAHTLTSEAPTVARWWKLTGQIDLNVGRYETALAALTIYGYLTPLSDQEKRLWADLSLQLGIPVQAAPVYEQMLAADPDPKVLKNLVAAYRRLGRSEAALAELEKHAGLAEDPELTMLEADLLYDLKRYEAASAAYLQAAREEHRRTGQAWLMAGYAAWQAKDIDTSRRAFEQAAQFKSQRRSALLAMRQLKQTTGRSQ